MTSWVQPDRLDRVSASGDSSTLPVQASPQDVADVLGKVIGRGRLQRLPRGLQQKNIVLAALCLGLRRRHPYTELELNDYLKSRLGSLRATIDHATCRRYLVDLGFLKRDRAGTRYLLNYGKLESTLPGEAAAVGEALLQDMTPAGERGD